jgi:outer membrane protein TolC
LISLPELPITGIPAELIRSRPDIRSAYLNIQAADMRTAAAVADQYPSLRLSASLDTLNSSTSTIFSDYLANVLAGLTAPLFDGGLRKAEVDRTRAVADEKLHIYGETVLNAVGEVEDALIKEQQQQQYIKSLQAQLDLAVKTMEQVKERYLKGVENYQRVLTALTSLQSLQQSMVTAQKDLLFNRIELCRALGTGWDYSTTATYSLPQLTGAGS